MPSHCRKTQKKQKIFNQLKNKNRYQLKSTELPIIDALIEKRKSTSQATNSQAIKNYHLPLVSAVITGVRQEAIFFATNLDIKIENFSQTKSTGKT